MADCVSTLAPQLEALTKLHADLYEAFVSVRKTATTQDLEKLVDAACILRDIEKLGDDLRTESKMLAYLIAKLVCMQWAVLNTGKPIRGTLCSASPQVRQMAVVPNVNRDPDGYRRLMKFLGCPDERIDDGVFHIHWPKLVDYITDRLANGLPMPEGVDTSKTYDIYSLVIRKNR